MLQWIRSHRGWGGQGQKMIVFSGVSLTPNIFKKSPFDLRDLKSPFDLRDFSQKFFQMPSESSKIVCPNPKLTLPPNSPSQFDLQATVSIKKRRKFWVVSIKHFQVHTCNEKKIVNQYNCFSYNNKRVLNKFNYSPRGNGEQNKK